MISATMAVKEEHGCMGLDSPLPTSGSTSLDSVTTIVKDTRFKEQLNNPMDDFAPKLRKPYTITKQRERWSTEEHKKFVDALKLYGRAWRRIEEHVGTKTAVQIRSHAQKFFSKVTRETNIGDGISMKPIEIPPPRPKRKPMHPYPRKMFSPVDTGISIPEKFPNAMEQENRSPTSILSGIDSDSSCGADYCMRNSNQLSVSYEVPKLISEDVAPLFPEREEENSCSDETMHMESSILSSQNDAFVSDDPSELATRSLKLFGKTLLIMDPNGLSDPVPKARGPELLLDKRGEDCFIPSRVVPLKHPNSDPISYHWLTLCSNNALVQPTGVHYLTPIKARPFCENKKSKDNEIGGSFIQKVKSSKKISGFAPYKRCLDKKHLALVSGREW